MAAVDVGGLLSRLFFFFFLFRDDSSSLLLFRFLPSLLAIVAIYLVRLALEEACKFEGKVELGNFRNPLGPWLSVGPTLTAVAFRAFQATDPAPPATCKASTA